MPVSVLFVEGRLDVQLLTPVLRGGPVVQAGGTKYTLGEKAKIERAKGDRRVCYVRDRDFDLDAPTDRSQPSPHPRDPDAFCWCRHEMENYLLEPTVVSRATGCDLAAYCDALIAAARSIREYEAARSAIGVVRRSLPPSFDFETRPVDIPHNSLKLPADLSAEGVTAWMKEHAAAFRARVCPRLDADAMERLFRERRAILSDELLASPEAILVYLSGKDLLAALGPWLREGAKLANPGDLEARVRDWMSENPEETLRLLPEWAAFLEILKR